MPNETIARALGLLEEDKPKSDRFRVINREEAPSVGVYPKTKAYFNTETPNAFVRQGDPTIYVPDWSKMYQQARTNQGDSLKSLAGALAHENHHQLHGLEEGPAYDAEIQALYQLGARKPMQRAQESQKIKAPGYQGKIPRRSLVKPFGQLP